MFSYVHDPVEFTLRCSENLEVISNRKTDGFGQSGRFPFSQNFRFGGKWNTFRRRKFLEKSGKSKKVGPLSRLEFLNGISCSIYMPYLDYAFPCDNLKSPSDQSTGCLLYHYILLQHCTVPQMILDRKWSEKSTANDPKRKIGMAWTQLSGSSCRFYYYYKKSD